MPQGTKTILKSSLNYRVYWDTRTIYKQKYRANLFMLNFHPSKEFENNFSNMCRERNVFLNIQMDP